MLHFLWISWVFETWNKNLLYRKCLQPQTVCNRQVVYRRHKGMWALGGSLSSLCACETKIGKCTVKTHKKPCMQLIFTLDWTSSGMLGGSRQFGNKRRKDRKGRGRATIYRCRASGDRQRQETKKDQMWLMRSSTHGSLYKDTQTAEGTEIQKRSQNTEHMTVY